MLLQPGHTATPRVGGFALGAWRGVRPNRALVWGGRHSRVCICGQSSSQDGSCDSEDMARELEGLAPRDKYTKLAAHLQLVFDATSERDKVEPCQCCRGSGEQECNWCHGTGAMTIGDTLYCSNSGCAPCPVCRGKGECQCPHCRGTGKRATWLTSGS